LKQIAARAGLGRSMCANAALPCLMKTTAAMGDIAKEKWTIRTPNRRLG